MQELSPADVTIVGAGLTGLSLAWFLREQGLSVRLIEKDDRCGGVIQTFSEGGFTYEAGPNTGLVSNKAIDTLLTQLDKGCRPEPARAESKARWIWKNGKWNKLPSDPLSGIGTPLFSASDKLRIVLEPFRRRGKNPYETLADMVKRRLGKSFLDYAVDPFISGVYAGDPNYLVTRYALPKLYRLEQNYGSFIGGSIKRGKELRKEKQERTYSGIFSCRGGLENMIAALSDRVGTDTIVLNARDTHIEPAGKNYLVFTHSGNIDYNWKSKKVVLTSGNILFEKILPFADGNLLRSLQALEYARVIQIAVGYKEWKGMELAAYGGLIPSVEKRNVLGILFPSSLFVNRAPGSGALLAVFMGGFRNPAILENTDSRIREMVLDEIAETLQVKDPEPDLFRIFRYKKAIPQYGASSFERLRAIEELESQHPGLILAGNIRDGIGMADRVQQAWNIASTIRDSLAV